MLRDDPGLMPMPLDDCSGLTSAMTPTGTSRSGFGPPRPRSRSDRFRPFFLYGLSDDGGRDDVDESRRAWRSSSSTWTSRPRPRVCLRPAAYVPVIPEADDTARRGGKDRSGITRGADPRRDGPPASQDRSRGP